MTLSKSLRRGNATKPGQPFWVGGRARSADLHTTSWGGTKKENSLRGPEKKKENEVFESDTGRPKPASVPLLVPEKTERGHSGELRYPLMGPLL